MTIPTLFNFKNGIHGTLLPGSAICSYLVVARLLLGQSLAERPLFSLGILLTVVGVQFISMGLLAEIQTRTYHESSNKPIYSIREVLDLQSATKGHDYVGRKSSR